MTAADLVIAELSDYAAELEHEVVANRQMVRVAMDQLVASGKKQRKLQGELKALTEELRRYVAARVA